jgi:hypothetical protein
MTDFPEGFHRPVPVHDLPAAGRPFHIIARADECRELARLFDLLAIEGLSAEGLLRPEAAGRRIRLEGRLIADVIQTCVVSLDPVPAHIDVRFERLYGWDVDEEEEDGTSEEVFLDLAGELPVERMTSDSFDLGAAAAEQLALELDPYPRKPGALFTGCDVGDGAAGGAAGPLHALSGWRNRGGSGNEG